MSQDIFANVLRAGIPIYAHIYFQIDNMSTQEGAYYGGAAPYMRYWGYPLAKLDIRQGDQLVDVQNIDPKTATLTQYRVINDPEKFDDQHMEIALDKVRGT